MSTHGSVTCAHGSPVLTRKPTMPLLLDTTTVAPDEREELWAEAHPRHFFPAALGFPGARPFEGRVHGHRLGPLDLYRVTADPNTIVRTRTSIDRGDPETLNVGLLVGGRAIADQHGRRAVLGAGTLSSWDTSRPFSLTSVGRHEMLLVFVPRTLLGAHADRMCAATARVADGSSGIGAIAGPFLRSVWDGLEDGGERLAREDLAEGALALVRALHTDDGEAAAAVRSPSASVMLVRMKSWIDAHLSDAELDPEAVARAHFVSVRYVHKLFEGEERSVSRWILQRRLERVRRDLTDPGLASETISTIGRRWGLANPPHLSRLFRAAYGVTPRELRALARAAPPG
jgi:AraC-like DNA-binding protein